MTELQFSLVCIAALFLLILLRFPIGVSLIAISLIGIGETLSWRVAWGALSSLPQHFAASWVLSSVPTFLFMGFFCYHTKLTQGLFDAARVWLWRLPGGLAVASVFGCSGFAAVTGSSVACAAAMGRVAVPEMVRNGYKPAFAAGTAAASGTIGALIPPSILMILYGIIAQAPISSLFLGGISIGIITMLGYSLLIILRAKLNPALAPPAALEGLEKGRLEALIEVWPVLLIVVGVFGGLFSGYFSATEAGAVGATLSVLVSAIKGQFSFEAVRRAAVETLTATSSLLIIAIGASLLTRFLALSGFSREVLEMFRVWDPSPYLVILLILMVYLVIGMVLEPIGAMLLTLPIFVPLVGEAGFSLIWFGILVTKVLEVGMLTPPVGMNVFVIKNVVGKMMTTTEIFRGVTPFVVLDLGILALMVALPGIVLYLPNLVGN
ncbi:TRAP transporter large permease [Pseudogemmobacter sonorensis]|uniref:TRAP transporter large permease n=1 Tax=Pseudogemmobacter sonorensis TaxID=2989681 RepID=UPI00369DFF38